MPANLWQQRSAVKEVSIQTCPRTLDPSQTFERLVLKEPSEQEVDAELPFPPLDDRPLILLTRNQQHPGRAKLGSPVTSFNRPLTGCFRGNTCIVLLFCAAAAATIFLYLLKYMVKDIAPLTRIVPVVQQVKAIAAVRPSTSPDQHALRPTQFVLLKMLNRLNSSIEVSLEMAAARLIDVPSEPCSHGVIYLFIYLP